MNTLRTFTTGSGAEGKFHSLPALADQGFPNLSRLPVSIRIVLESLLRNNDGLKVGDKDIANLASYNAKNPGDYEIPFVVARIVLQDFTGVPLLVDLAAMRSAVNGMGRDAKMIEPLVPVDLVVDHSVQVDYAGTGDSLNRNLDLEFHRNRERYEFLKWGEQAFDTFKVVPPGIGIVHQVNLEYLAKCVLEKDGVFYPDTLVGTDSHTTMINGLGVVGWGVGGIEAEAGMLGQPVTFLVPEVVGVHLTGELATGVTATDLVLLVTEVLRKTKVVGKFVEFYGPGAKALSLPDRATIANMAPEYGATMGFFGIDEITTGYLAGTGRSPELCKTVENYYKAQGLWGIPTEKDALEFSQVVEIDLSKVKPSVAGPKRPQDRIELDSLKSKWASLLTGPAPDGYNKQPAAGSSDPLSLPSTLDSIPDDATGTARALGAEVGVVTENSDAPAYPLWEVSVDSKGGIKDTITHGSVLIAAITSCTNTSNPSVMLAAGLLAKKANALGLTVKPSVKTSLGPGSRVVTDYLNKTGLQAELDKLSLKALLNLPADQDFELVIPQVDKIPVDDILSIYPEDVYQLALSSQPQIRLNDLRRSASEKNLLAARGQMKPTVSAFGQLASNFNQFLLKPNGVSINGENLTGSYIKQGNTQIPVYSPNVEVKFADRKLGEYWDGYSQQLRDQFGQGVGISINVPIFNGSQARSNVKRAMLDVKRSDLSIERDKLQLKQDVYTAYYSASGAFQTFVAREKAMTTAQRSFDLASKRFELGVMQTIEWLTNQNNLTRAKI
ncbi:MAG: aconitate hydratase AcnA, partial [Verrucomicrobiota bacterium]